MALWRTTCRLSAVYAKARTRCVQQRFPLQAKGLALNGIRVMVWVVFWGGIEGGIQFATLLFAPQSAVNNTCIAPHTSMGLLLYYAPFLAKVLWAPAHVPGWHYPRLLCCASSE